MMNRLFRIFVILVLLSIIGTILYFGLTRNDSSVIDNEPTNNYETLNIDSGLVKTLYSYVEDDFRCSNIIAKGDKEIDIDASNLDYDTKFMMAVTIMLDSDKDKFLCNEYEPSAYFKTEITKDHACGNNYYNEQTKKFDTNPESNGYTTLLKEDKLKIRYEQIFGRYTYEPKDLIRNNNTWYRYINTKRGYALLTVKDDTTCSKHINELKKAIKDGNNILLTEEKRYLDEEDNVTATYNYTYTYTKDSDNSYYLQHIKSIKL